MNTIKQKWEDFKEATHFTPSRRRKIICYVLAAAVAFGLFWLFFTQRGYLAQRRVMKSFGQDYQGERNVKVYSGTSLILEYSGHYTIETYDDKIVILNRDTHEVVEVYGDNSVIVDSAYMSGDPQD